jgi:hypothetical protein
MMRVVSINGRLLPRREARVSVTDGGFLHGEGLFETIRLYRGKPLFLRDHHARLGEGARLLGLACPAEPDRPAPGPGLSGGTRSPPADRAARPRQSCPGRRRLPPEPLQGPEPAAPP